MGIENEEDLINFDERTMQDIILQLRLTTTYSRRSLMVDQAIVKMFD